MEERIPPKKLSKSENLQHLEDNQSCRKKKKKNVGEDVTQQWKKKSIFFNLPYWEFNPLPHNLDLMHIEKNVFDNVIFTLLSDKEKSKDHVKAQKDLQDMGIRNDLWVDENDEFKLDAFAIPKNKKVGFLKTLKNISVLDGYSSNISRRIDLDQKRIFGLKSHDCHILMQHLLLIAIRNVLLRQILFPPLFFTVIIHLIIYLIDEVKKGGPVHYRWMYFVERLLGHFKSLVGNKSQPEGSIAESYIVEEALTLYSRYFEEIESRLNRPKRVNDEPSQNEAYENSSMFPQQGKHVGGFITEPLAHLETTQAHRYVLLNCAAVKPFIEIMNPDIADTISDEMKFLAQGPARDLEDIVELNYYEKFRIVIFKCQWADTTQNRGFKIDAWKFNCVNFSKLIHTGDRVDNDPYIESSQVNMVYYVDDENDKEWSVAVHLKPRDLFDMGEIDEEEIYENEPYQQQEFG
ncbi:hypothetical protein P3S68_019490 [Capsicum galapagoense]